MALGNQVIPLPQHSACDKLKSKPQPSHEQVSITIGLLDYDIEVTKHHKIGNYYTVVCKDTTQSDYRHMWNHQLQVVKFKKAMVMSLFYFISPTFLPSNSFSNVLC